MLQANWVEFMLFSLESHELIDIWSVGENITAVKFKLI